MNLAVPTSCVLVLCTFAALSAPASTQGDIGGTSTGSLTLTVRVPTTVRASLVSSRKAITTSLQRGQLCLQTDQAHRFHVYVYRDEQTDTDVRDTTPTTLSSHLKESDTNVACATAYRLDEHSLPHAGGTSLTLMVAPE